VKIILRGLGVATPSLYATQEEAYAFFTAHCTLKQEEQELYRRILLDGKIKGRYLGMDAGVFRLTCPYWLLSARALKLGANGLSRRAGRASFSAPELRPWAARPEETVFPDGRAAADQLGLGYPLFISFE